MSAARHHHLLLVLGLVLFLWGIFLFFQSAYFGAFFYGVPVPFWAAWVGLLPLWSFDAIDTVMVAVLVIVLLLSSHWLNRRVQHNSRGSAGWALVVVGLFLVVAFLAALGFNLLGLWTLFKSFFAGL